MAEDLVINGVTYPAVKKVVMKSASGEPKEYFTDAVRTVNGEAPDENGNVEVEAGSKVFVGSPEDAPEDVQIVIDPNGGADEFAELQETVDRLSEEIDDQQEQVNSLTLGIASDGLIYLFKGGSPVGTGIPQGQSGDVFGYVDENNTIVLTGKLADGTYNIKYEMEDGSTLDIGELELGEEEDDGNLLPKATKADGTEFVGTNGEKGYTRGYYLNRDTAAEMALADAYSTGFMPATVNDKVYIKDITMHSNEARNILLFFNSNHERIYGCFFALAGFSWITYTDGVICFTLNEVSLSVKDTAYIRLSCGGITDDTIITVNKPIA